MPIDQTGEEEGENVDIELFLRTSHKKIRDETESKKTTGNSAIILEKKQE